ncbi:response regulator [Pseudorhodobacter sp. E13]|uniref:ATP-binding protein n=1 Tax=Pseudorhodobacter sp. E13 TaxID=2487931 RepID=UPI000F8CE9C3|nr:ATP-binding protein [Pseudorhodobacter sp. E13]RUS60789.1 response regulator [Pseudorhodobacter sp. E13]
MVQLRSRTARRARLGLSVLLGTIGVVAIVLMAINVARDLRLLNSASSDNVQWTLSQAEVEFLEYELHLERALRDSPPDLTTLRREFDIFYSRVNTLRYSSLYATLRESPAFLDPLGKVQFFLDASVEAIDADDATLTQALPDLLQQARDSRGDVRMLSNAGLNFFAEDSDRRRNNVAVTLTQMAAGVTFLLLALLGLTFYLSYLNSQNIRRRAEVVQASARMKIVMQTALDAVIVSDQDGIILDYNSAAEQIFGHPASHAIGKTLGALIVPDQYLAAHEAGMERMRAGGEKRVVAKGRIKLEAKRANGEIFPVEFAIQSADTDAGEIFIAFLRDISHRVRAEKDLLEARDRALAGEKSKTDFLATMSHEIRTPLNGLLGNLSLLRETRLSARQARYIKNMETSGKLLMSHISDVLDITKYDAGKLRLRPVAMNISALIQDIVDNQSGAASANGTSLKWGWLGPASDWLRSDPDRIQHILMNVVGNAVKFTRDGSVSIEVELIRRDGGNPDLQISVRDTGIGIDAEFQAQIFDDFATGNSAYDRETGGTGLGLGIAQRFVKALGGSIEVESEKGIGSTFRIRFPVEPIAAPDARHQAKIAPDHAEARSVLLVEDNEINRVVAREMLAAAGHRVTEAPNGKLAVDLAQAQRFDLILMDISMPVMDGRSATRAIRAGQGLSAQTPIIAVTANAMAEEQQAFLSDGMNDILTKPLTREALLAVIANHGQPADPPGAKGQPSPAPVARHYIDELRDSLGVAPLQGLLDRFIAEVDQTLTDLGTSPDMAPKDIAARAHRIAGSAATMGAVDLRAGLIAVETAAKTAAKTGDKAAVQAAIAALPAIWAASRPYLRAERREAPRPRDKA